MSPADLADFWQRTRDALAKIPVHADVKHIEEPLPYHSYRLTFRGLNDVPVRAYLSTPHGEGKHPRRLPAVVTAPGYSGYGFDATLAECQRGYVILQIYPRGQGESAELWKVQPGAYQAWVNHGKHNPEGFYYQGGYTDFVRGIDYLLTRDDVDPARIGFWGASQAGMIALAVGAIDSRVRAVCASLPALCNFRHNPAHASCKDLTEDPVFLDTFDYFDPINLAPWIKVPTLISSGGKDTTCPPDMIRAVWDRLPGIKALYHDPELTHTTSTDFYRMVWDWLGRYL